MLNEVDFELVSDYINATEKVELIYRFDNNIKLYADTHTFKKQTYKTIINFKEQLKINNDEFIKFVGLSEGGNLIAQVKTFDSGIVEIDMSNYNSFNNARQDFYNKLKEVNGYTTDFYKGKDVKIDLFIDNVKLNPTTSNTFKRTYKNIINFKNELKENNINLLRIPYYNLDSIENILDKAMS